MTNFKNWLKSIVVGIDETLSLKDKSMTKEERARNRQVEEDAHVSDGVWQDIKKGTSRADGAAKRLPPGSAERAAAENVTKQE